MNGPDNHFKHSGNGDGTREAFSYQLCSVGKSFATNAVKTSKIDTWWYEEIGRINPAGLIQPGGTLTPNVSIFRW